MPLSPVRTVEQSQLQGHGIRRMRAEFPVAPQLDVWDVVTDASMSMTPAQTTQGTVLAINTGTTVNATSSITSKEVFTAPFRATASIQLSQKIANCQVYFEAVACDPVTGVIDESRVLAWRFCGDDSVTATQASYDVQNGGAARFRNGNQSVNSYVGALTTTAPVTTFELEHLVDDVFWHYRTSDNIASARGTYQRTTTVPNPNLAYKIRVRILNGGVAPASTTTVWVGHITADSHTETPVELVGGRGSTAPGQAMAVAVTNSPAVGISGTQFVVPSSSATVGTAPTAIRFDALLATASTVKATAGRLFWAAIYNPNAAMAAVHFYNATAPTVGTTAPVLTIPVAAGATVILPAAAGGYLSNGTAITVAATTTATTAGAVAPTTGLSVAVGYL